jgi:hypothetical protein
MFPARDLRLFNIDHLCGASTDLLILERTVAHHS